MSITKVAKVAGVSSSTVSRVINNHPRVAPATVEAVRKAMEALSYTPSDRRPGPKPLKRQRPQLASIKLLALGSVRGSATPGFAELLGGVSLAATQHGARLSFSHVRDVEDLARHLREEEVDGLLLHGQMPGREHQEELERYPTVWLMGNRNRPDWGDQVMPDAYAIGELAATYLAEKGHKELAFLNLEACFWPFGLYEHAFLTTARKLGLHATPLSYERNHVGSYWEAHSTEAVEQLVDRLLEMKRPPTGVFVADDMQVAQIQPALQRRGVGIGMGGMEIISCNNEMPYLAGLSPRPMSIDIRLRSIGQRAFEQLRWRLQQPRFAERLTVTIRPQIARPGDPADPADPADAD